MLFVLLVLSCTMCLHPIDRTLSNCYDKYKKVALDEFDNCDYVTCVTDITNNDLVVIQLNIRGLSSKCSQLLDLINSTVQHKDPDLILLSETWLTPYSPTFKIPGYEFHHLDRQNRKGGGVGILASLKLRCSLRNDLTSTLDESECITVDITKRNGEHCLVSSMYRPPNSDIPTFLASYNSLVYAMRKECPNGTIVGLDHNLDFLKACSHGQMNDFTQYNLDLGMIPIITRPMRIMKSSATLIDNIIVSQNFCGKYVSSILVNDMSDHLPTICVISSFTAVSREKVIISSRDTRPKNMKALRTELNNHDWSQDLKDDSPSVNMENVHNVITTIVEKCIPTNSREIKHKNLRKEPWLTSGIKMSIDKNKKLYAKSLKQKVDNDIYRDYNKNLRKIIRIAKNDYYQDKCAEYKSQAKKLWNLINEISGKKNDKSSIIEYLQIGNVREYGAKKISNSLAKYFAQVGKKFADKIPSPTTSINDYLKCLQSNKSSIFLNPTDIWEIKRIVNKLPAKKSSGHDNISNILLKEIVNNVAPALSTIFNKSMVNSKFPSIMKLADVVPLYKGKEHFLETNYRPISLLTTISKVLEKIVYQ